MAAIAAQTVDSDGLPITFANASGGGDTAKVRDENVLLVKNDDSGSHTVTLATAQTVNGLAVADRAIPVAAGAVVAVPLRPRKLYADANGEVAITYDAVTSLKVAVVRL